jgi:hypothetical protein
MPSPFLELKSKTTARLTTVIGSSSLPYPASLVPNVVRPRSVISLQFGCQTAAPKWTLPRTDTIPVLRMLLFTKRKVLWEPHTLIQALANRSLGAI